MMKKPSKSFKTLLFLEEKKQKNFKFCFGIRDKEYRPK